MLQRVIRDGDVSDSVWDLGDVLANSYGHSLVGVQNLDVLRTRLVDLHADFSPCGQSAEDGPIATTEIQKS
jgi:hypothetical protein